MTGVRNLLPPITGEVDAAGILIRADATLTRLQMHAGGTQNGMLALPALAALAAKTHQLKMRLSDVIKIADDEQDIQFWAETELREGICQLQLWGCKGELELPPFLMDTKSSVDQFEAVEGCSVLICDVDRNLIAAQGDINVALKPENFGANLDQAIDLTTPILGEKPQLAVRIDAEQSFTGIPTKVIGQEGAFIIDGTPQKSRTGEFIGFRLLLRADRRAEVERDLASENFAERMMGKQISPALRLPLSRIIANAETIGDKLRGPVRDNYAVYAQDIASAARHLLALVDDLSDLEAVDRPDFSTASEAVELGDVARRVAGLLALKAADSQIQLRTPREEKTAIANAEFRRVLQIVINLVANAIRYSPHGSLVEIEIDDAGKWVEISVSDEGNGIVAADRERVFAKFERLGRSGDGGSGLGLYISRRLARFMGGDLTVSESTAGGAKFTLSLPLRVHS
jgi:signal transduction histidine kinase